MTHVNIGGINYGWPPKVSLSFNKIKCVSIDYVWPYPIGIGQHLCASKRKHYEVVNSSSEGPTPSRLEGGQKFHKKIHNILQNFTRISQSWQWCHQTRDVFIDNNVTNSKVANKYQKLKLAINALKKTKVGQNQNPIDQVFKSRENQRHVHAEPRKTLTTKAIEGPLGTDMITHSNSRQNTPSKRTMENLGMIDAKVS